MLIGLVVFLIDDLLVDMCSLLEVLQLLGVVRNSLQFPCQAQRLSTGGAAMAACEVAWLHKLLYDMHQSTNGPVVIYCDNMSSIYLENNPVYHARTKHIEVNDHYV